METKTKTIKTSGGHEVVLKEEISAKEFILLRDVWLNNAKITGSNPEDMSFAGVTGAMVKEHEQKSIGVVVISIDGNSDKILDQVLELSATDYQEIVAEVHKVTAGKEGAGTNTNDS